MTTAPNARLEGDNEFPVLLRLPDLNAPVWSTTAPATIANSVAAPVSSRAATYSELASSLSSSVASVVSSAMLAVTPSSTSASTAATLDPEQKTSDSPVKNTSRPESPVREPVPEARWNLIRQMATGGVLVGGVALAYFMFAGGGDEKIPDHIPAAQTTIEPPVIETPNMALAGSGGPVVVRPAEHDADAEAPFNSVPAPPDFSDGWADAPRTTPAERTADGEGEFTRRAAAETSPRIRVNVSPTDFEEPSSREVRTATRPVIDPPTDGYRGRIGPTATDSTSAPPAYPETDPATFLFRPAPESSPDAGRPRAARVNGYNAPGPRR